MTVERRAGLSAIAEPHVIILLAGSMYMYKRMTSQ